MNGYRMAFINRSREDAPNETQNQRVWAVFMVRSYTWTKVRLSKLTFPRFREIFATRVKSPDGVQTWRE